MNDELDAKKQLIAFFKEKERKPKKKEGKEGKTKRNIS